MWFGEIRLSLDFRLTLATFGLFGSILGFYEAVHGTLTSGKGDVLATFLRSFGSLGLLLMGVGGGLKVGWYPKKAVFCPS